MKIMFFIICLLLNLFSLAFASGDSYQLSSSNSVSPIEEITENYKSGITQIKFDYNGYKDALYISNDKLKNMKREEITALEKERYDNYRKKVIAARSRPAFSNGEKNGK